MPVAIRRPLRPINQDTTDSLYYTTSRSESLLLPGGLSVGRGAVWLDGDKAAIVIQVLGDQVQRFLDCVKKSLSGDSSSSWSR